VAGALGALPADIVSLRVIDREHRHAVDEICVEAQGILPDAMRDAVQAVPATVVETIRRIERIPDPLAALEVADRLVRRDGHPIETLIEGLPEALPASWAMALDAADGPLVRVASNGAPPPGDLDTPWLPLVGARRLELGERMPPRWRMSRFELAAAPLDSASSFVIVGRWAGMRFRTSELRSLELLSDLAVRSLRTAVGV
jgi:hypothetical protein